MGYYDGVLVVADENSNIQRLRIEEIIKKVPKGANIPETLASYNPKRKYHQNCGFLFQPYLKE